MSETASNGRDLRKSWLPLGVVAVLLLAVAQGSATAAGTWTRLVSRVDALELQAVESARELEGMRTRVEFWRRYLSERGIPLPDPPPAVKSHNERKRHREQFEV